MKLPLKLAEPQDCMYPPSPEKRKRKNRLYQTVDVELIRLRFTVVQANGTLYNKKKCNSDTTTLFLQLASLGEDFIAG